MKKILLISFFKSTNLGDNAICATIRDMLASIAEVTTMDISGKPMIVANKTMPQDNTSTKRSSFYAIRCILSLRKPNRFVYAKSLIKDADMVILAGGNMIMDLELFSGWSYLCQKYIKYAKQYNKKVIFAFVGVGKIRTFIQRYRWKRAVLRSDMIAVRDELSKKTVEKIVNYKKDIKVWKDPVFLLNNIKPMQRCGTVAINIYADATSDKEGQSQLIQTYLFLIKQLRKQYKVILYATEKLDRQGLHEVYNALENKDGISVICPQTIQELLEMYKNVDLAITTRMHAFIIATTQNIPTLIFSWSKKIDGVAGDLGLSRDVYNIHRVYDDREKIVEKANNIMRNIETHTQHIERLNADLKPKFIDYIECISKMMEE